jgi:predicted nucleotidyltransferase
MESTGSLARNKSTMGEESSDFDILINMQKYRSSPALAKLSTVNKADKMNLQHVS